MSIIVTVEDREGEIIGSILEIRVLQRLFASVDGCCLSHLSEFRDAMFNTSQIQNLKQELETLEPVGEDEKKEWRELIRMANQAAERENRYLRFYGEPEKV